MISISTIKPVIYSSLPCPSGCSLSTGLEAKRKPMSVTTDEPASETLLKASAITATDAAKSPAVSFPANKSKFNKIPVIPASAA